MTDPAALRRYRVEHSTRYEYVATVMHGHHLLHLSPRQQQWQRTMQHDIDLHPITGLLRPDTDAFGNPVHRLEMESPHQQLIINASSEVLVSVRPEWQADSTMEWEQVCKRLSYRHQSRTTEELEAISYRAESPHVRVKNVFADFATACFPVGCPILVGAQTLMSKIYRELAYAPGETQVNTSVLSVLESRRGVCQDFAHLMIACLRSLGLSARYVSGYLRTRPPEGEAALVGVDASHAWVSVYAPPYGWVDLDPTNDLRVGLEHITLGWGRDFSDVSPIRGVIVGGGEHQVTVAVTVTELNDRVMDSSTS